MQRRTESSATNCCRQNPGNDTSEVYKLFIEWQSEKNCSLFSEEKLSFVSLSSQIMPHFVTKFVHEKL